MIDQTPDKNLAIRLQELTGINFLQDANLMKSVFYVNLAQGQVLFNQGEVAHHCFLVIHGNLKISKKGGETEAILTILSEGEFGGGLLMRDSPMNKSPMTYPGTVAALTQACVLKIPKETFRNHWEKHPTLSNFVNNCIRTRMQFLQEDRFLQTADVETRIVNFLCRHYLDKKDLLTKKISRKEIARAVGAKTETVIRALKKLERDGVIKTQRASISILDQTQLYQKRKNETETQSC